MHYCLVLNIINQEILKDLMEAVCEQVSPINSLFCRYPLTTIHNFDLSRLPSD